MRHAADMVIDAAGSATIEPALYDRLTFCAKTVEAFAIKVEACSDEVFAIGKRVSAVLAEGEV